MTARGLIPVLVTLLSLVLAACGFQPMYGARDDGGSVAAELGSVEIDRINVVSEQDAGPEAEWRSRLGQQLEDDLASRFYRGGMQAVRYRLDLDLTKTREGFGFRPDEAVTRVGLRLEAQYRLVDVVADKVILQNRAQAYNSFEVVQSDFATLAAEEDMEKRLVKDLGQRITSRLGQFFGSPEFMKSQEPQEPPMPAPMPAPMPE